MVNVTPLETGDRHEQTIWHVVLADRPLSQPVGDRFWGRFGRFETVLGSTGGHLPSA